MKILENFSSHAGVKIKESPVPFPVNFHPIPEKFITISAKTGYPSRDYDHLEQVVSFLIPILYNHGINIIQIGEKNEPVLEGVSNKLGIPFREIAYIVNNSLLHVTGDCGFSHLAGHAATPLLCLYGSTSPEASAPYWSGSFEILCGYSELPSYQPQEEEKQINNIPPENVANKIFEMLGLKERVTIKTISFGRLYYNPQISLIPDFLPDPQQIINVRLAIRMDVVHNEQTVFEVLKNRQKGTLIFCHQPLTAHFLNAAKSKISRIVQSFDEETDLKQLENLRKSGIPYTLIWKGEKEKLSDIRLELFDYNPVGMKTWARDERITKDTIFATKSCFVGRGKQYATLWHYNKDVPGKGNMLGGIVGEAIESDDFWESQEALYFFEPIKNTK